MELEDLAREVSELRQRVLNLERRLESAAPESASSALDVLFTPEPKTIPSLESAASVVPQAGRVLLALAGAYLLRALTEYGVLPPGVGVACGILYALAWLLLASRAPVGDKLTVATHGLTAALIFNPLVYEATTHFQQITPATAAAMLTLFALSGLVVSWRKNLAGVAWITTTSSVALAAILLQATRHVFPFTLSLLAIAAAVEVSAYLDHWLSERWLVAGGADLAAILITYLVTLRNGPPEGYPPLPAAFALLALALLLSVYLGSTVARTLIRGLRITVFETLQVIVVFVIALGGGLQIAAGQPAAAWAVGGFALLAGAGCYLVSFAFLERKERNSWNLYTYSSFAALLVLAGSRLLLPELMLAVCWSGLGLYCLWIGVRSQRTIVGMHAAFYLLLAGISSGAIASATASLLQARVDHLAAPGAPAIVLIAAAMLAAIGLHGSHQTGTARIPIFLIVALHMWTAAGIWVWLIRTGWVSWMGPADAAPVAASASTLVLSISSAFMAWSGRRWNRPELLWLAPPGLILTGYKLVTQDLPLGQTATLFVSMLSYGSVLMLLPRLMKQGAERMQR